MEIMGINTARFWIETARHGGGERQVRGLAEMEGSYDPLH